MRTNNDPFRQNQNILHLMWPCVTSLSRMGVLQGV